MAPVTDAPTPVTVTLSTTTFTFGGATRPAETNGGTTTPWMPMTLPPFTPPTGCESSFWKVVPTVMAGWDPGYGITVQPGLSCHPPEVTSWWDAEHLGVDVRVTQYSLGPVVCPASYSTVMRSTNRQSSTLVACCPNGYDFVSFFPAGVVGECTSSLTPGQFVRYATFISGSWRTQSSTVLVPSVVYGIPVNGWLFPATDGVPRTVPPIPTNTGSTSSGTPAATGLLVSGGLPESARIGIGVGVPLGLIFLGLLVAAVALWNRKRKREQQEDSDGHHSSEKPAGSGIGAGLFGGRGGGDQFPPATASTFGGRKSSHVQSPSPVTRGRTRERTSRSRSSQRIIGTAGSAGAGLVSGWRSLAGSVTSPKSPGGVSSFTGGTDDDPAGFKMPAYAYPTYEVRDMPPVEEYAASGAGAAASTSDGRRNSDGSGGPAEGSGARERLVPR